MELREVQRLLANLAETQYGVFGVEQLAGTTTSTKTIHHLVRRGSIERLGPRTYRMSGVPQSWRSDLAAGLHALGPTAVVSHRAAARLHGFDRFNGGELEFTVARDRRGAFFLAALVHTSLRLPDLDTTCVAGLRVTNAARTIIDLAGTRVRNDRLEAAVDSALRLRLTTTDEIAARLRDLRGKGRRGVRRLDRVLVTSGGHSYLEREFLKLVDDFDLPRPIPQVEHRVDGVHIARVNFSYPQLGIVVEVSGGRGHSSAADRGKDARRRNELQRLGKLVLEFTYEDVMQRRPYVAATLTEAPRSCRAPSRFRG
jgi:hypothetical protein